MDQQITLSLTDRLRRCADKWVAANEASLARLGRAVVNHNGFFTDLDRMARGPSTDTLEKFARFLSDGGNWPEGRVPQVAVDFAHVVGISADEAEVSAGLSDEASGREKAA